MRLGQDEVPTLARGLRVLSVNLGMGGSGDGQGHWNSPWRAPVPVTRRNARSPGSPLLSRPDSCRVQGARSPSAGLSVWEGDQRLGCFLPLCSAWEEEGN